MNQQEEDCWTINCLSLRPIHHSIFVSLSLIFPPINFVSPAQLSLLIIFCSTTSLVHLVSFVATETVLARLVIVFWRLLPTPGLYRPIL